MEYLENMHLVLKGITQMAMPGDGKFDYPVDKKRTKQTTDKMIAAEKNLDLFWARFVANWKRTSKKHIDDCMRDHKPRHRGQQIERTTPWVEPIQEPRLNSTPKDPKPWTDTKDDKLPIRSKEKVKTKGVGAKVESQESTVQAPGQQDDKQPKFKVDKTMLKVFNTLFFTPG